ncbi:metallophosphoesterase [Candidatus Micrarchaeota archaeon]|nr:metallophosphoesterase [Candidatus Micrarchaeota archaeon]
MKFVVNEPAALIGRTLIISDVHLGLELELERKGFFIKDYWKAEVLRLNSLLKKTKATKLIVLGDFKHDYYGLKYRETRLLDSFLKHLDCKDVIIVKGNHDSSLESLQGITLIEPQGLVLKQGGKTFGLFHGHALPSKEVLACDYLLLGNTHPTVEIKEGKDFVFYQKCWLVSTMKKTKNKVIVFPAFSELVGGSPVNKEKPLGPLFNQGLVELKKAEVFLLSGLKLGLLKDLSK